MPAEAGADGTVVELRRLAAATPRDEPLPDGTRDSLDRLPADRRREVAGALSDEADPRLPLLGATVFLDLGDESAADRALAAGVLAGADLGGLFYGWLHGDRPDEPVRRYVGVSRALLARYDDLAGDARARAERFLCDESLGEPLAECSPAAVRARLLQLETELEPEPSPSREEE